jgi:hypothetical protein
MILKQINLSSITEEKPTHKRKKQSTTFPAFLPKKRTRDSTKAATTTTPLNPQPILLNAHTPPPSQILEFLPVQPTSTETQEPAIVVTQEPTTAETQEPAIVVTQEPATAETQEPAIVVTQEPATAETQEPDANGATTSFSLHQVVFTQEPATHSVVVTQEPATHSVVVTQEPAIVVTQEPATAETQEPAVDFIAEIQESHAQGVATLFYLHQVDETQESAVDFVAAPQEPATEVVTVTQKPVTPLDTPMTNQQPEPTMASLLQENEFLRSELEAYKQELVMAKEAYGRELNLYTLACVAAMAEKNTKDDQYREYMCSQCGDMYDQEGYKVVQIPMPRASPAPTTFAVKKEERPTVTQEPVGPSKIKDNLQEP